jgi:ATP-dependent Clp endopeptidase proteolytic subunit ClpP
MRAAAEGADEIVLEINSLGGSVFDAIAIFNALRAHDASVTVKVMGVAASAASYIAMAGDKIVMPSNSFLMVHNPMTGAFGNANELQNVVDALRTLETSIAATYVKRSKKGEDDVKAILAKDTYLTADEALDFGFCDEVIDAFAATAAFDVDHLPENVRAVFVAQIDDTKTEPVVEDDTKPETAAAVATAIVNLATEAGFAEHATAWALNYGSVEDARAALVVAQDTRDMCALARLPEKASAFIVARTPVADVRVALAKHLAETAPIIDNVPPQKGVTNQAPATKPVTTAGIWAATRRQHKRSA